MLQHFENVINYFEKLADIWLNELNWFVGLLTNYLSDEYLLKFDFYWLLTKNDYDNQQILSMSKVKLFSRREMECFFS
jgi:hypothetical protein